MSPIGLCSAQGAVESNQAERSRDQELGFYLSLCMSQYCDPKLPSPIPWFPSRLPVASQLTLNLEAVSQCMDSASCSSCPVVHCACGCSSQTANSWSSAACHAHLYRLFASCRASCLTQIPKSSSTTWLLPSFRMLRLQKW